MTLTLSGSLLGRQDGRFLFQRGTGVFAIGEATHRLLAHIDRHRPASGKFENLCNRFGLDPQAVKRSQTVLEVSTSFPLDEQVFRIVGTGTITASGGGVESSDGVAVSLTPGVIALWAIASRKPNLAEAVSIAAEIAGCSPKVISDEFVSVAPVMVAARVIDVGMATRPPTTNERNCYEH